MKRALILGLFLIRNLFRSFAGLAPLGTMLAAYTVTFFYQDNSAAYFAAVGGFDMALVCAVATLCLAAQAGHPRTYLLLVRLHSRTELLLAIVAAGLGVSILLAAAFWGVALLQGIVTLTWRESLLIAPRWLALFPLAATLALHLSQLAARTGSRLAVAGLLLAVLLASDQQIAMQQAGYGLLLSALGTLASPLVVNLMLDQQGVSAGRYAVALLLPLAASGLLFWLATRVFQSKDLLWTE